MSYRVLTDEQRAQMLLIALSRLEGERFEAELNASMADDGVHVMLSEHESAAARIARIDRQLERLYETYGDLIG